MTLPEDLKQLLLAFNAHKVEYLVVGAYAVGEAQLNIGPGRSPKIDRALPLDAHWTRP